MNKLPLLALLGCSQVPEECQPQLDRTTEACESADVIGTHENKELHKAVDDLKACIGYDVKVICSDDGWQKALTITKRD